MSTGEPLAGGRITLHCGDCLDVLAGMEECSVDSVVTDPPYGLEFMGKDWDAPWKYKFNEYGMTDTKGRMAGPSFSSSRNPMCQICHKHKRGSKNHIACSCDSPEFDDVDRRIGDMAAFQAWCHVWAQQVYRVMKPGSHMLAFGGTRTFHRLVCAIEDAGFEVRDTVIWTYFQGFPKSLSVSKAIDREAGAEREVIASVRVKGGGTEHINRSNAAVHDYRPDGYQKGENVLDITVPATDAAREWDGWGTALKPAVELICLARKPLSERTVAANVLAHGTGGLNVDACRVATSDSLGGGGEKAETAGQFTNEGWRRPWMDDPVASEAFAAKVRANVQKSETLGRWPANLIHDGSDEVLAAFPESISTGGDGYKESMFCGGKPTGGHGLGDSGSAARFFYTAKADADDRLGSKHPTVKPVDLIQYLARLITPPSGLILDPFAGTGTLGEAALREGFRAVLIEREAEYQADIRRRLALASAGPVERRHESIKARGKVEQDAGPLFASREAAE